jgi:WD repeat-containing protein 68
MVDSQVSKINNAGHSGGLMGQDSTEVFTYVAPWDIYAMSFCQNPRFPHRLAIGSYIEAKNNWVEVVQLDSETKRFERRTVFDHPYAPTKAMWIPDFVGSKPDLLATSGECIRIWQIDGNVRLKSRLFNTRNAMYRAPLTSFDWNKEDTSLLGTASIDTTCTIWDVEKETVRTQLIAHDKEVLDFAFNKGTHQFATVSADCSVRIFDLRDLQRSVVAYESPSQLLRVDWNKQDEYYLAFMSIDCNAVTILDVRSPMLPVAELRGHSGNINAFAWAPHSNCHLCSAGEDRQALIWDLQRNVQGTISLEPILSYVARGELSALQWSQTQSEWIAVTYHQSAEILKV